MHQNLSYSERPHAVIGSLVSCLILGAMSGCATAPAPPQSNAWTDIQIVANTAGSTAEPFVLDDATVRGVMEVWIATAGPAPEAIHISVAPTDGTRAPVSLASARGDDANGRYAWDTHAHVDGPYDVRADVRGTEGWLRMRASVTVDNHHDGDPSAGSEGDPGSLPGIWQPEPGTSWQWQLTGTIDTSIDADVYDIDLFDTPKSTIDELRGLGRRVICYFSAGSYEAWRSDASLFPAAVRGRRMDGWDEDWLDIRRLDVLGPIMQARLDLAHAKGCDAVEPDNVDGYANATGFALTYADQLAYNRFLATQAHARGLSIGLKNDLEQIPDLLEYFDFAVNEECFQWRECDALSPFVEARKAVFGAEYGVSADDVCPVTNALNLDFIIKKKELDAHRIACR